MELNKSIHIFLALIEVRFFLKNNLSINRDEISRIAGNNSNNFAKRSDCSFF